MKRFLFCLFSSLALMLLMSFSTNDCTKHIKSNSIGINANTPFPLTGKVTVYGAKGGRKQVVGEITYSATIEVKESSNDTYSIVTVTLNNKCKHDVSGYVYGIRNGQRTNHSKFEIAAENTWKNRQIMSGEIENIKIDVLILDLGIF